MVSLHPLFLVPIFGTWFEPVGPFPPLVRGLPDHRPPGPDAGHGKRVHHPPSPGQNAGPVASYTEPAHRRYSLGPNKSG